MATDSDVKFAAFNPVAISYWSLNLNTWLYCEPGLIRLPESTPAVPIRLNTSYPDGSVTLNG